jgi:MFS transporter, putative metabolite:H+ symporter
MKKNNNIFQLAVIVSALGFFVDVYDLLLFAIIRKPSLAALGLNAEQILSEGETLISIQMIGLLLGGILFGILGDKKGRLSVLFGSILLYSVANILNGMVSTIPQYMVLRFLAGIGLAGELGAGLTLVSEILPKEKRSVAAGLIAGFGIFGAVFAFFIHSYLDWRICYYIGGVMGLLLLMMRVKVSESVLYNKTKDTNVQYGNFLMFFNDKTRFLKYLQCVLIGLPVWYIIGILVTFADQFGKAFGITDIDPAKAIMYLYLAIGLGDFSVGWLSERLKSRKKTLLIFMSIAILFTFLFFLQGKNGKSSSDIFYLICLGLGFGAGFNVVYLTMGVEQFGTNLRASAAISIPNMVRGSLPLLLLFFKFSRNYFQDYLMGAWVTGIVVFALALWAAYFMDETYGKDLDFLEK